jgi:hypothetical protein
MYLINATQSVAKDAERWRIGGRATHLKFATVAALVHSSAAFLPDTGSILVLLVRTSLSFPMTLGVCTVTCISFLLRHVNQEQFSQFGVQPALYPVNLMLL